jgi:uncharacterized protein DUF3987
VPDKTPPIPSPEQAFPSKVVEFPRRSPYTGPVLPEICWRRGFLEFRDAHAESTEACSEFLYNAYLVGLGCIIGRNMNIKSSFSIHPNIYSVNVGTSGKSRKTTAQNFLQKALHHIGNRVHLLHGISSPEGLISVLSQNPRVLIILNEIKTFFVKGAQDATRGLIPRLTELYDCPPEVTNPTRNNPTTVQNPFVCMIASTTREWFQNSIDQDDIHGGLAGRFLYFTGQDRPPKSWPPPPDDALLEEAINIMLELAAFHTGPRIYEPSPGALAIFDPWYHKFRTFDSGNELLDVISQRLHTHAMKMAMIFAGLDGTCEIGAEHIEAAIAFADYQREVHAYILEGIGDTKSVKDEERVIRCLARFGWQTPREVQQRVKGLDSKQTKALLTSLLSIGRIAYRSTDLKYGPLVAV